MKKIMMDNDCRQLSKEELEVKSIFEYTRQHRRNFTYSNLECHYTQRSHTFTQRAKRSVGIMTDKCCPHLGAVTDFFPCSKMRCILLVLVSSAA